jgi:hypothetical protein
VPVIKDEEGFILEGFARAQIARDLGYECPSVTVRGLSEQEKRSQLRALNLSRLRVRRTGMTAVAAWIQSLPAAGGGLHRTASDAPRSRRRS